MEALDAMSREENGTMTQEYNHYKANGKNIKKKESISERREGKEELSRVWNFLWKGSIREQKRTLGISALSRHADAKKAL